jgi:hypothetical protein
MGGRRRGVGIGEGSGDQVEMTRRGPDRGMLVSESGVGGRGLWAGVRREKGEPGGVRCEQLSVREAG